MDDKALLGEIENCILDGDSNRISETRHTDAQNDLLPHRLINEGLLKVISKMGRVFRDNEVYMPDVMLKADATQTGLNILKPIHNICVSPSWNCYPENLFSVQL